MKNSLSFENKDSKKIFLVEWGSDQDLTGSVAEYLKEARVAPLNRMPDGSIEIGPHGMRLMSQSGLRPQNGEIFKIPSKKEA